MANNKFDKLNIIKTEKSGMDISGTKGYLVKTGQSVINWMPHGRNLVVIDETKSNAESKRLSSLGLIDPKTLSDAERLALGGVSKSAEVANKASEDQDTFEVVAVGPEVAYLTVGDKIMVRSGGQFTSFKIDGKFYYQLGEHDVLGKFL